MNESAPPLVGYVGYLLRRAAVRASDCAATALPEPHQARHLALLAMIREHGPLSQRELGVLAHINRTIMVKLVDEMESHGLVVRERNPDDRRSYALTPTERGDTLLGRLAGALAAGDALLTAALDNREHDRLNQLLDRLLVGMAEPRVRLLTPFTGYLVSRAHHVVRTRNEEALAPLKLLPRLFGALSAISQEEPCSQQRVAEILGVTPPMALKFVDELEAAGLVSRRRNVDDRRAYDLTLTRGGWARLTEAREAVAEVQRRITGPIGSDGEAELRALLLKLLGKDLGRGHAREATPAHRQDCSSHRTAGT